MIQTHEPAPSLAHELAPPLADAVASVPWATTLNVTASAEGVSATLLTLTVASDLLLVAGVLVVGTRRDSRVATVPSLQIATRGDKPWPVLGSRVVPQGRLAWVTWTFRRPAAIPERLIARIADIVLEHRVGGGERIVIPGPWEFDLPVDVPPVVQVLGDQQGSARRI